MAKLDLATLTKKMHSLLKDATPAERQTIVKATLTLFGEAAETATPPARAPLGASPIATAQLADGSVGTIREFFDAKQPKTKLEQLAVAARHREMLGATSHTKDDFKTAFGGAKRPFDANHFPRDMGHAKTAKFFNLGRDHLLSYYGEQYVDALPDRDAAAALKRPGKSAQKKKKKPAKKT